MKYLIFTLCFIGAVFLKTESKAQQNSCRKYYDKSMHSFVYTYADQMPEYPGGFNKFFLFFAKRIKYDSASLETWQSKVTLVFIIDTLGNVKNAGIDKKSSKDYSDLENEYLSLLPKTLKWEPGKCNGRKVPVRFIAPFLITPQM